MATRFTMVYTAASLPFSPSLLVGAATNAIGKGARGTCHKLPQLPLGSLWDPSGIPLGYLWDPSGISSIYSMLYSIVTSTSVCECAGARVLIVTWSFIFTRWLMTVRPHHTLAHLTPGSWFSWSDFEDRQKSRLMLVEVVSWSPLSES